ncbi:MAG: hypothetical protein K9M19_03520 [Candidatus Marinimicrobia bacterium]|nr:hypothetical protein [Candidatus Neomarinimicrobiota bacterium]
MRLNPGVSPLLPIEKLVNSASMSGWKILISLVLAVSLLGRQTNQLVSLDSVATPEVFITNVAAALTDLTHTEICILGNNVINAELWDSLAADGGLDARDIELLLNDTLTLETIALVGKDLLEIKALGERSGYKLHYYGIQDPNPFDNNWQLHHTKIHNEEKYSVVLTTDLMDEANAFLPLERAKQRQRVFEITRSGLLYTGPLLLKGTPRGFPITVQEALRYYFSSLTEVGEFSTDWISTQKFDDRPLWRWDFEKVGLTYSSLQRTNYKQGDLQIYPELRQTPINLLDTQLRLRLWRQNPFSTWEMRVITNYAMAELEFEEPQEHQDEIELNTAYRINFRKITNRKSLPEMFVQLRYLTEFTAVEDQKKRQDLGLNLGIYMPQFRNFSNTQLSAALMYDVTQTVFTQLLGVDYKTRYRVPLDAINWRIDLQGTKFVKVPGLEQNTTPLLMMRLDSYLMVPFYANLRFVPTVKLFYYRESGKQYMFNSFMGMSLEYYNTWKFQYLDFIF